MGAYGVRKIVYIHLLVLCINACQTKRGLILGSIYLASGTLRSVGDTLTERVASISLYCHSRGVSGVNIMASIREKNGIGYCATTSVPA